VLRELAEASADGVVVDVGEVGEEVVAVAYAAVGEPARRGDGRSRL
jgi:DNA-binding IclR family transcriptional regulator